MKLGEERIIKHTFGIERAVDLMLSSIDTTYSTADLARVTGLSRFHFIRIFQEVSGITPIRFLYAKRLQLATTLLVTGDDSVLNICFQTGYNSYGSFTSRFTELVGAPPSQIRRMGQTVRASGVQIADVRRYVGERTQRCAESCLEGRVTGQDASGVVFVGLFASGFPSGMPLSCTAADVEGRFSIRLPEPMPGDAHLFAMTIPWADKVDDFLVQKPSSVGRFGPFSLAAAYGDTVTITLRPFGPTDPPILFPVALHFLNGMIKGESIGW